ncbi:VC0807 family protein [Umezawaea sp. Da 62-37]|uniref:VC0807 family protein n=1 Tax=Umezawaea sp. Da 62-37 TaxID=3075927 RepID=UPI0028F6FEAC|nr:VC0807 family protein [Umezawaea sp. Da 62-37]WNV90631.1 VC0807 family protein [Umezawaea sp. Da 62-37]
MDSRIRALLPTLLVDLALPVGGYYLLRHFGVADWIALTAGGAVSGAVLVAGIARGRTVDGAAILMLGLFAFGLLTLLLTGDARFVIAKDSLLSLAVGLVFLGSLFAERPLLLTFAAKTAPVVAERYRDSPAVRRTIRFATVLWGVGMLVDAAVRVPLAYTLPVDVMVIGSPALTVLIVAVLVVVTRKYAARQRD